MLRIIAMAFTLITALSCNARAAEIHIKGSEPYVSINIKGKLEKGDYNKMISEIKRHGKIPGYISVDSELVWRNWTVA
jgi:hypothetical protein